MKKSRINFLILFYIHAASMVSQTGKFFTTDTELSNSLINCIYQDQRNYVWVATEDGLNRYDGVKFVTYRSNQKNPKSIKNNYVHTVFEDSKGRFWVGCVNGLLLYDREQETFEEIKIFDNGNLIDPDVTSIYELSSGEVWISVSGKGIARVADSRNSYSIDRNLSSGLSSLRLESIYEDSRKEVWILSNDQGLFHYSPKTKKITTFNAPEKIGSNQVSSICEDSSGNLFVGTLTSGLFRFDRQNSRFVPIKYSGKQASLPIKCLLIDSRNQLLVGTDGNGMKIYQPNINELTDYKMESTLFDLDKIKVHSLMEDNLGNLWIGIFQKGVYFNPNNPNRFRTWGYKSFNNNLIGSSCVMSVIKDKENTMWVGTDNDGLYAVYPDRRVRHFTSTESTSSVSNTIMSVFEDSNGDIWLGSYLKGLSRFNKTSGQSTYFNVFPSNFGDNFLSNKVLCITEDNDKNLLIGTNGAGIYVFNLRSQTYTSHYSHQSGDINTILNSGINSILVDKEGLIWAGTFRGVSVINTRTAKIIHLTKENNTLPGSIIYAMLEDTEGDIWIGTDEGLARYNKKTNTSRIYSIAEGLPSNVICGIQQDEEGNIWLSTHMGISKLQVADEKFINHYASDGLQGNEFSRGASFKAADGEMLFGGISGISSFYPNQIISTRKKLDIFLTELDILDAPVRTNQKSGRRTIIDRFISDVETIHLAYKDNMFSLEFSTFNFGNADRVYYRYMLEGLNSQWMNTAVGTNRISFTNLNYGKYKLRVKAYENENESDEKTFDIIVYPPWYLSTFAHIIYFLILLGLIFGAYRFVKERIQHRHELIRREHLEQINEGKLQFFINISHEIRTPMTLILSPLEKLMQDKSDPERTRAYQLMYRNAQRILRLINQLLDLRKIDKRLMFVKMRETNIVSFVDDLVKTFEYQSNKTNIKLSFIHDDPNLNVWIDMNNFDKVLVNILSNAFKFTPENGEITIRLKTGVDITKKDSLRNYFELTVSDNGIGIKEDKIEKIFERFYQIDSPQNNVNFGTGIGLHLSKNLVELMHGEIFARNRTDVTGSEFIIRLPLGSGHLLDSEKEHTERDDHQHTKHVLINQMNFEIEEMETQTNVKPKTKYRVLIVDDETEIRHYLKQNLSDTYKVMEAANGKIALELILKEKPDLVISDVMMPEMDGITLCKKIKANINIMHIPVVLLTAKTSDEDKAEGYETGADAYVAKPFNVELLKKRIISIIENRSRLEEKIGDSEENKSLVRKIDIKSQDQILMEKVIRILNENIEDSTFNTQVLADKIGISRVHLHRKMKELTNQSAADFIKTNRLKQAAELLQSKKYTVSEVCYKLGFSNLSHFSSIFKEFYGVSPKEYTQNNSSGSEV